MPYLIDITEEFDEQVQEQLREFRQRSKGTRSKDWYAVQKAVARARELKVYHRNLEGYIVPDLFTEEQINSADWYRMHDPERQQVSAIKKTLKETSCKKRKRGRVNALRLKAIMKEILERRIELYMNPVNEKLKILCIVGESGSGKTLASLHLQNKKGANVICSFTTRPPRKTEMEGREHHFIDIIPDPTELLAYAHFGGHYYYALKTQVFGPLTVYVVDEKGLINLKKDHGDEYEVYSLYIRRDRRLKLKCGVSDLRIGRDKDRIPLPDSEYDWLISNNGTKKAFFTQIDAIYDKLANQPKNQK